MTSRCPHRRYYALTEEVEEEALLDIDGKTDVSGRINDNMIW